MKRGRREEREEEREKGEETGEREGGIEKLSTTKHKIILYQTQHDWKEQSKN